MLSEVLGRSEICVEGEDVAQLVTERDENWPIFKDLQSVTETTDT